PPDHLEARLAHPSGTYLQLLLRRAPRRLRLPAPRIKVLLTAVGWYHLQRLVPPTEIGGRRWATSDAGRHRSSLLRASPSSPGGARVAVRPRPGPPRPVRSAWA